MVGGIKMTENIEDKIITLIATDRIDIPISSMSGKLKRAKPKLAKGIAEDISGRYEGSRVYARIENEDEMKARGMKEGIELFSNEFPKYGTILRGLIEEQRALRETHLYFGVNSGCRLTADDYMGVITGLGFSEARSRELYPDLMDASRSISRKREEERSVLIG